MRMLSDLIRVTEGTNLDALPEDTVSEIQKNVRAGAKDLDQKWANALELTHKAYEVAGVQRPTPDMKNAWKQYEEILQYAVQQLSRYRGIDGDWRMSSAIFHEALELRLKFSVRLATPGAATSYVTEARSLQELVDYIVSHDPNEYEIKVKYTKDGLGATIQFFRFGVKVKYRVDITQMGVASQAIAV